MPILDFWYEFASTYSYPAAMRIGERAAKKGVDLRWRPFLLGPIFASQGWTTSPFNLYPAKGRYMWRDMARITADEGLTLVRPEPFPQNSLSAARLALALEESQRPDFSRAVYLAEFAHGRRIDEAATLAAILVGLGLDAPVLMARAGGAPIKEALKANVAEAQALGVFGAPSFTTADGELFWGFDRMEAALDWAARG